MRITLYIYDVNIQLVLIVMIITICSELIKII